LVNFYIIKYLKTQLKYIPNKKWEKRKTRREATMMTISDNKLIKAKGMFPCKKLPDEKG